MYVKFTLQCTPAWCRCAAAAPCVILCARTHQVGSVLQSVTPTTIGTGGGSLVTITGVGFVSGQTEATIGNENCALTSETGSELVCSAPALAAGSHDVEVRVASFYNYDALTITVDAAYVPVISSVDPTTGRGGDAITINGQ